MVMFVVVTGKVTEPAEPAVSVPACAPTDTVFTSAGDTTSVATPDCVPSIVTRK